MTTEIQPEGVEAYAAPDSLAEALELLAAGPATVLAGGTDLMVQGQSGRVRYQPTLVNVRRLAELRGIDEEGETLRIGALTTITELLRNPVVGAVLPPLAAAADRFASPQIRNAATVGGNICNASPAGDTLGPLMVLDAEVELARAGDQGVARRRLPLQEFFAGPGRTHIAADELLVAVHVPRPAPGFAAGFEKFGSRPALDISTVSVTIGGVREGGTLRDPRMVLGAVAPVPYRARAAEAALAGAVLDAAAIAATAAAAREEIQPIDDVRASAWYRQELVASLTKKVLRHVSGA